MRKKGEPRRIGIVIGEPCVGKSAIMKAVLKGSGWTFDHYSRPYLPHHKHTSGVVVFGRYDEDVQFPGTDRMSMATQPHAIDFVNNTSMPILFEGDRLGTVSMIDACRRSGANEVMVFVVCTSPNILRRRRTAEREQSERFVQSRRTKINNIIAALPNANLTKIVNNKPEDVKINAMMLRKWIGVRRPVAA